MADGRDKQESRVRPRHRVNFHLTGFGEFNDVPDNPTRHLVKGISGELEARRRRRELEGAGGSPREVSVTPSVENYSIRSMRLLEVSAAGGGRELRELFKEEVKNGERGAKGVADDNAEAHDTECGYEDGAATVFIHCGVNKEGTAVALETNGFNEATFRVPDERGYTPSMAPVDESIPDITHCRVTTLPVADVLERLRRMGWGEGHVITSGDAGRFVCNYVYYTSLGLCERLSPGRADGTEACTIAERTSGIEEMNGNEKSSPRFHSLFIHVPPFEIMPLEQQLAFLADCLSAIAESLGAGSSTPMDTEPAAPSPSTAGLLGGPPDENSGLPKREPHSLDSQSAPKLQADQADQGSRVGPRSASIWDTSASPEISPPPSGYTRGTRVLHDETDEDPGYVRDDDDDEEAFESSVSATRRRLIEAGFEELDVDAAMATTGSDRAEVNMQFLLDMAPLLPHGAPTDVDSLCLQDVSNNKSSGAHVRRPSGTQDGKHRAKCSISPAGMGGVSPKWVGDASPVGKASGGPGKAFDVNGNPSANGAEDQSRGRSGGLLNRFRRHRRVPSTASETTEDGAGKDPINTSSGAARWRTHRGVSPDHEYGRKTTGRQSKSPTRALQGNGLVFRTEESAGWGETLPTGPNLRLAVVVRGDLGMGPGAVASQCSRAVLAAARKAEGSGKADTLAVWREAGEAIVVLSAADAAAVDAVLAIGAASHLPITMIRQKHASWMGSVSADTCTVAAFGPAPLTAMQSVLGSLPVL